MLLLEEAGGGPNPALVGVRQLLHEPLAPQGGREVVHVGAHVPVPGIGGGGERQESVDATTVVAHNKNLEHESANPRFCSNPCLLCSKHRCGAVVSKGHREPGAKRSTIRATYIRRTKRRWPYLRAYVDNRYLDNSGRGTHFRKIDDTYENTRFVLILRWYCTVPLPEHNQ